MLLDSCDHATFVNDYKDASEIVKNAFIELTKKAVNIVMPQVENLHNHEKLIRNTQIDSHEETFQLQI